MSLHLHGNRGTHVQAFQHRRGSSDSLVVVLLAEDAKALREQEVVDVVVGVVEVAVNVSLHRVLEGVAEHFAGVAGVVAGDVAGDLTSDDVGGDVVGVDGVVAGAVQVDELQQTRADVVVLAADGGGQQNFSRRLAERNRGFRSSGIADRRSRCGVDDELFEVRSVGEIAEDA